MGGDVIRLSVVRRRWCFANWRPKREGRQVSIGVERLGSDKRRSAWRDTCAIFHASFTVGETDTQERRLADSREEDLPNSVIILVLGPLHTRD